MRRLSRFSTALLSVLLVLGTLVLGGKQAALPESGKLNVLSFIHFNTNVSDFKTARAFYGRLGFTTTSGFPDANTQAMARAIGVQTPTEYDGSQGGEAGGYLLHGELIGLGGFGGGLIDLIEFTIPRNEEPPYAKLNHLGMASAILSSHDVERDYQFMKDNGVTTLAPPIERADGVRFFVMRDPDGTYYEIEQSPVSSESESPPHLSGIDRVRINVSDLQRSLQWYALFGYEPVNNFAGAERAEVAAAMGFDGPIEYHRAVLRHRLDGSGLELTQWQVPFDPAPPYPLPVNHLGIHRIALLTADMEADVQILQEHGVPFVSPVTPCCSGTDSWGSIVAFEDPDGTIVELAEQPGLSQLLQVMLGIGSLF